jgi:hypothetical protein
MRFGYAGGLLSMFLVASITSSSICISPLSYAMAAASVVFVYIKAGCSQTVSSSITPHRCIQTWPGCFRSQPSHSFTESIQAIHTV